MGDHGLFIGWGAPLEGGGGTGLGGFGETGGYYGKLPAGGRVESFEAVLLDPHGGDLEGFILIRGTQEQMAALQGDAEFRRLATRASLIIQRLGIVPAVLGEAVGAEMGVYQRAASELT